MYFQSLSKELTKNKKQWKGIKLALSLSALTFIHSLNATSWVDEIFSPDSLEIALAPIKKALCENPNPSSIQFGTALRKRRSSIHTRLFVVSHKLQQIGVKFSILVNGSFKVSHFFANLVSFLLWSLPCSWVFIWNCLIVSGSLMCVLSVNVNSSLKMSCKNATFLMC